MFVNALAERNARGERLPPSPPDSLYYAGLETRRPGEGYDFDGMRRGDDPKHPRLLVQITLSGEGNYAGSDRVTVPVGAGAGFFAVLPSVHRYHLPASAPANWSFFYLLLRHPYIVTRLATRLLETGAVWDFGQNADAPTLAVREGAARLATLSETVRDPLDAEAELFAFLLLVERAARAKRHGGAETAVVRDQLLAETRRFVENHLTAPIGVPDLARAKNMERSRYSHYFRSVTGETPAKFMTQVRLEVAARKLAETDAPLESIAVATGFADANHLCKVFRRLYHVSPGAYRKQLR